MSVIAASSVKVATLVDGTLRVTMDVEPKDAQAAFALFAKPGTPMALAALKSARSEPAKPPVGPVCQWAVMQCQDETFRRWLGVSTEESAKAAICGVCHIDSRKDLDTNPDALELFHKQIRLPYAAWLKKQRVPA